MTNSNPKIDRLGERQTEDLKVGRSIRPDRNFYFFIARQHRSFFPCTENNLSTDLLMDMRVGKRDGKGEVRIDD